MTTRPTATPATSLDPDLLDGVTSIANLAIEKAIAATEPTVLNQHGAAFLVPSGYELKVLDMRAHRDPTPPPHRAGRHAFVGVASLASYVNRYKTDATLGYVRDLNGRGATALTSDVEIANYVLDDHPADDAATGFREHIATLVLRPTAAARRWGSALAAKTIDQELLLDLVVDGIAEIAEPDGATLRDLVSDLHAIRTSSARSVLRTGGQATVEVADNVSLHSGTGTKVTIPEQITIVFTPYAVVRLAAPITLVLNVKPKVGKDEKVSFTLEAPALDDELARVVADIAGQLEDHTDLTPMWQP